MILNQVCPRWGKTIELTGIQKDIFDLKYKHTGELDWLNRATVMAKYAGYMEPEKIRVNIVSRFCQVIKVGDFVPAGRIIAGCGLPGNPALLNCYSLSPTDTVEGIGKYIKDVYTISCAAGGIGSNFSEIRPKGNSIQGISFSAPGSVSIMQMVNEIAEHVKAGKNRRVALLGGLDISHPDILEFLHIKLHTNELNNFNISVGINDKFLEAIEKNQNWSFFFNNEEYYVYSMDRVRKDGTKDHINVIGTTKEDSLGRANAYYKKNYDDIFENVNIRSIKARELWDTIWRYAVESGDPGVLNLSKIQDYTNTSYFENLNITNPCVAKGTLVDTPDGPVKVEDLKVGDFISTVLGEESIESIETHSNVPVYKICFSDGGEQIVTAAHQYHVSKYKNGKKKTIKEYTPTRVDQINPGDWVRVAPTGSFEINKSSKEDILKYNDGLRLGILLGDGCYTNPNNIRIASSKDDEEYNKNVKNLFGIDNFRKDDICKKSKSVQLSLNSSYSRDLFNYYNLSYERSHEKDCPDGWLKYREHRLGILDGLVATDGNVNLRGDNPQVRIVTASKKLALTIRRICLHLGYHGRIYEKKDIPSFIDGRKVEGKHQKYVVMLSGSSLKKYASESKLLDLHPEKGSKLRNLLLNYNLTGNTWKAKVKSIESIGNAEVYDLYCENSDTWITDGYVQRGCGELPLDKYGSCCLGSINLSNMVENGEVDWRRLAAAVRHGVRFLDNILSVNGYPIPENKVISHESRKIGLGVMGLHHMLIKLGYRYGSEKCLEFLERLFDTIKNEAYNASAFLAEERGSFPKFDKKLFFKESFAKTLTPRVKRNIRKHGLRNATILSIAPTGTISMLMGTSSGIEPIFSPMYFRKYKEGNVIKKVVMVDPLFKQFYDDKLPLDHFVGAYDVTPEEHIKVQATIQKYIGNSISKTINLPALVNPLEISDVILDYIEDLKGITVYRAGSKGEEPLEAIPTTKENIEKYIINADKGSADGTACSINGGSCSE